MLLLLSWLTTSAFGADLIVDGTDVTLSGDVVYDDVQLLNGARILVTDYNGTTGGILRMTADSIYIDPTSSIRGGARGYRGGGTNTDGEGPGGGGNGVADGGRGGGHGGRGGDGINDAGCGNYEGNSGGNPYNNTFPSTDTQMGSGGGGGNNNGNGGDGGAAVWLLAKTITVEGTIAMNGQNGGAGGNDAGGAGSGGGILIAADVLDCTGDLNAVGGNGVAPGNNTDGGGGGAGGVVEQYWHTSGSTCTVNVSAGSDRCGVVAGSGLSHSSAPGATYFDWDLDGYTTNDCDVTDDTVNPGATEACNGVDDDCNGSIDDGAPGTNTWYGDKDDDGFGSASEVTIACTQPGGSVAVAGDCDDQDDTINPDADEVCAAGDEDCDTLEGDADPSVTDQGTYYTDSDGDSFGATASATLACVQPGGTVAIGGDCNDGDGAVSPAGTEVCGGADEDCDGLVDDADSSVTGTSTWYADSDGDTFGDATTTADACVAPGGYVADATDCNDGSNQAFPGGTEVCDALDNDCNGTADDGAIDAVTYYDDTDSDSYGDPDAPVPACSQPGGTSTNSSDCDDTRSAVNPDETEVCNGLDDDCDGTVDGASATDATTYYLDVDNDGYGLDSDTLDACAEPAGYTDQGGDCNDDVAAIRPGASEQCNLVDDDCDGAVDEDVTDVNWYPDNDYDGFGEEGSTPVSDCEAPPAHIDNDGDCDDQDGDINPNVDEVCNGVDDNCDGQIDEDDVCLVDGDADTDTDSDTDTDTDTDTDSDTDADSDTDTDVDTDADLVPETSSRGTDQTAEPFDPVGSESVTGGGACGCDSSGSGWGWLLAAPLLLMRRRRL